MGGRINTIMQTCFFAISGVLPREEAIAAIKHAIEKTYGKRGESVVQEELRGGGRDPRPPARGEGPAARSPRYSTSGRRCPRPRPTSSRRSPPRSSPAKATTCRSAPCPSTAPSPPATAQWEKRNIALEIPVWDEELCIQCGKCVLVCPHSVIRAKVYDDSYLGGAPATFKSVPARWKDMKDRKYTLQVAPEDCTGCTLCVEVCPAKSKSEVKHKAINMVPQPPLREPKPPTGTSS